MAAGATESSVTGTTRAATSGDATTSMTVASAASPTSTIVRGNTAHPSLLTQWTTTIGSQMATPLGTRTTTGSAGTAAFMVTKAWGSPATTPSKSPPPWLAASGPTSTPSAARSSASAAL